MHLKPAARLFPLALFTTCIALVVLYNHFDTDHSHVGILKKSHVNNEYACPIDRKSRSPPSLETPGDVAESYCAYIKRKCNTEYFWIAERYYCPDVASPPRVKLFLIVLCTTVLLCFLFVSLSILVANYLYPLLHSICSHYGINEKFLSFILVPFINCFPDLVNYYITMKSGSIDLTLGQVVGSALIIFTLVMGSISFLQPFEMMGHDRKLVMNDFVSVFLVIGVFLYIISDGVITRFECTVMVALYLTYVAYLYGTRDVDADTAAAAGEIDFQYQSEPDLERNALVNAQPSETQFLTARPASNISSTSLLAVPAFGIEDALSIISDEIVSSEQDHQAKKINYGSLEYEEHHHQVHQPDEEEHDSEHEAGAAGAGIGHGYRRNDDDAENDDESFRASTLKRNGLSHSEISLRSSIWNEGNAVSPRSVALAVVQFFQVALNLIDLALYLMVPFKHEGDDGTVTEVIGDDDDLDEEDRGANEVPEIAAPVTSVWINWRTSPHTAALITYIRYLRCLIIPVVLYDMYFTEVSEYYLYAVVAGAVAWEWFGRPYTPEIITQVFAAAMTLVLISEIATLVLQLLKNMGVILRISESLLGLTIFAVSNCINDIIVNVTLANVGKPILGINACLGTPLLSILLGIGFNGLLVMFQKHGGSVLKLDVNLNLKISTLGLLFIVSFYLLYIPLNGWRFDRRLGLFAISWWVVITTINCIV